MVLFIIPLLIQHYNITDVIIEGYRRGGSIQYTHILFVLTIHKTVYCNSPPFILMIFPPFNTHIVIIS